MSILHEPKNDVHCNMIEVNEMNIYFVKTKVVQNECDVYKI